MRTRNFNVNQYQGWNFGGDRTYSGGNINSHWTFTNYYSIGGGYNVDAAPFRDRVTRGGPGVLGNPSKFNLWYYANTDNRKALSFYYNGGHWVDTKNSSRHDIMPGFNWRATSSMSLNIGLRYFINHDDSQWVDERGARRRPDALRVRPHRSEDDVVQHPLQLHDDAEPVAAGVRGAVRVGRQLLELQGAGRRPRREVRGSLPAVRLRRQRRLQHPLVPHHQRAALGIQARLVAVPGVAAEQVRTTEEYGDFRFGRDFDGVFSAPSNNVFLVKFSYWLNM